VPVKIGTSGWQYRHWLGTFYPEGLATGRWLGFYAGRFDTVEVDSAFYRLPPTDVFARWCEETPEGYLRFHAGIASPRPCYGRRALSSWASRIAQTWPEEEADVYAYFDNDSCTCAPHDAQRFATACAREGLRTSRVPARGTVTLCE
jgi:uncharacterized protein YecE (DUF72 family)